MDRKLIEYLPEFMREYKEMKIICDKEQEQIEGVWKEVEKIWDNQFIATADEITIRKWENILKINVGDTWTLDDRRNKVLSIVAEQRPYTDESLNIMLRSIFGEGNYKMEYINPLNMLVSVSFDSKNEIVNVEKMLNKMLPANLRWSVDIFHNKYLLLQNYTHEQLKVFTHEQMRDNYMFE